MGAAIRGMGAVCLVTIASDPQPSDEFRVQLMARLAERFTMIPDTWIDEVAGGELGDWSRRDAVVRGVAADAPATPQGIRRALADAAATLHLSVDPAIAAEGDAEGRRLIADYPPLSATARTAQGRHFRPWRPEAPGDHPTLRADQVRIGSHTIACGVTQGRYRFTFVVNVADLIAVIEDPSGGLQMVDRSLNMVSFHPELFRGRRRLLARLERLLDGVPRLHAQSAPLSREELRQWTRRARTAGWWQLGAVALVVGAIAAWNIVPRLIEQAQHPVRAMGETAELASGATLRVSDPDVREVSDGIIGYQVRVEFCGGTSGGSIGPGDFLPMLADESVPQIVPAEGDLERSSAEGGACVDGTLTYGIGDDSVQTFTVLYTDSDGTQIVWDSAQ